MRILHTESSKHLGGQELRVLMEMEDLRPHGFESVLVARPGTDIEREEIHRWLRVHAVALRGSVDNETVTNFM